METLEKASSLRWEAGRSSDGRISPRRRTLARVRLFEGPALEEGIAGIIATDLSADGAFLRNANAAGFGERVRLSLEVPTDPQPIELTARIVRVTPDGRAHAYTWHRALSSLYLAEGLA